jgi:succinate dehydrogenase / fumarate reductase flavoprotein subunit
MIKEIRAEFWKDVKIPGDLNGKNAELEKAWRVADYIELGELMARDALIREESCGGHFREEYQTPDAEALRDDANFMFVGAWEFKGVDQEPVLHKEPLNYEFIEVKTRNYKE